MVSLQSEGDGSFRFRQETTNYFNLSVFILKCLTEDVKFFGPTDSEEPERLISIQFYLYSVKS